MPPQPASAKPASAAEEEPIWIRRERERELQAKEGKDLPFGVYLLFSAFVAIAAVGVRCAASRCVQLLLSQCH